MVEKIMNSRDFLSICLHMNAAQTNLTYLLIELGNFTKEV